MEFWERVLLPHARQGCLLRGTVKRNRQGDFRFLFSAYMSLGRSPDEPEQFVYLSSDFTSAGNWLGISRSHDVMLLPLIRPSPRVGTSFEHSVVNWDHRWNSDAAAHFIDDTTGRLIAASNLAIFIPLMTITESIRSCPLDSVPQEAIKALVQQLQLFLIRQREDVRRVTGVL